MRQLRIVWKPQSKQGMGAKAYLGSWIKVAKQDIDESEVKGDLTISNPAYWQAQNFAATRAQVAEKIPALLQLYKEDEKFLYVPRHYLLNGVDVVDERPSPGGPFSISNSITLRNEVQAKASRALQTEGDKLVALACGLGKTVISIKALSESGKFPALIVVHTNALMSQWRDRLTEFLDIAPDQIGLVQGPTEKWQGLPIAIGMLQSLVQKKYSPEFYNYWKTVIFDECHKLGAQHMGQAAPMFPGERWGLSATVKREDRMERVFQLHLGEVVYQSLAQPLSPKTYFVDTGVDVPLARFTMRSGRVNMGQLLSWMAEHPKRNELIFKSILTSYENGRTILILGERLTQLHLFFEKAKALGLDASLCVGQMDAEARKEALTKRVVFATQHLAKEGLDRPEFDTLVIPIPFGGSGRLQQSVGRILRTSPDKRTPKVYIFTDKGVVTQALARKMQRALQVMGHEFQMVKGYSDV